MRVGWRLILDPGSVHLAYTFFNFSTGHVHYTMSKSTPPVGSVGASSDRQIQMMQIADIMPNLGFILKPAIRVKKTGECREVPVCCSAPPSKNA